MKLALLSDTHGLLRDSVPAVLKGCNYILHAGDIGKPSILSELEKFAPVAAIRGNVDGWAAELPDKLCLELEGWNILMVHDRNTLSDRDVKDHQIIVSGHSHKPLIERSQGKLWINPGSIGPRRFTLPISMARMNLPANHHQVSRLRPQLIQLPG